MRLKFIYLLLLQCTVLLPCSANQNQKGTCLLADNSSIKEIGAEVDTTKSEAIAIVKDFYKTYVNSFLSNRASEDSVKRRYLTPRMVEKVERIGASTDANPIIRAQDFSEDAINTLKVKALSGHWYMVSYSWGEDTTNIPLKVIKLNGRYMIDYITPEWNNTLYGDSLLCDNPIFPIIDTSTPLAFLKTFYDTYTMKYCSMPEALMPQLSALRTAHFTSRALEQFNSEEKEFRESDGTKNYDLLIDGYDFDCLWRPSIKVTQLSESTFQVSYTDKEVLHVFNIKVTNLDQKYRIDEIIRIDSQ